MRFLIVLIAAFFLQACAGSNIFPAINANMSNPLSLAVDSTNARLYINNSNGMVMYSSGSVHTADLTDPVNPTRLDYLVVPNFACQMYLDTTTNILYTPDRLTSVGNDYINTLFSLDLNTSPITRTNYEAGLNPYGIACCDPLNRLYVAAEDGSLDYYELDNSLARAQLDLDSMLDTGYALSGNGAKRVAILNNQAVVTRMWGGVWIVNLDQVGTAGTYPIDYFVSDFTYPRGITTDGTYIYLASIEYPTSAATPYLYILDPTALPVRTDNTSTQLEAKGDSGLIVATIALGNTDPREVVVAGNYAYVTDALGGFVAVVDIVNYAKVTEISVGNDPYGMAIYSPGGTPTHLYVANYLGNDITVVDISTNAVVGSYP